MNIKNKILGLIAILSVSTATYAQDNYTINGTITALGADGKKIYIQQFDENYKKRINVDSATVVDSKFTFTGVAPEQAAFVSVVLAQPNRKARPMQSFVVLEPGNINVVIDTISVVNGTVANDKFSTFMKTLHEIEDSEAENSDDLYAKTYYDYAKANSGTPIGDYILLSSSYLYPTDQLRELLATTSDKFKQTASFTALQEHCAKLEASSVGKQYINVQGKTPEGKDVSLSDYIGKSNYVLIDFWASWCGPCRKEMPSIVKAYAEYKPKGLEIVGISLDTDNESWVEAIKQLDITWPQMSDLKGWKSALSDPYGVSSIPNTVIVDKEGKIVARGLYGEDLLNKLAELLK